jgi:hypothetical protein
MKGTLKSPAPILLQRSRMDIGTLAMNIGIFAIVFSIGVMYTASSVAKGCPVKQKPPEIWKIIILYVGIFAVVLGIATQFTTTTEEVIKL